MIWTKFYWNDWDSDKALKLCSLAAQGLWMRMLCIAGSHEPVGYVAVNGRGLEPAEIATMAGRSLDEVKPLLEELERNGVFSRDRGGRIYNRKMVKDAKKAETARKNGSLGGNPTLRKGEGNRASDNLSDNGRDKPHKPEARSQNAFASHGAAATKAAKRKPETSIPADFPDADALKDARERAAAERSQIAVEREAERFKNHAAQTDRKARDWRAAWRNWVLSAIDRAPKTQGAPPAQTVPGRTWSGPPEIRAAVVRWMVTDGEVWAATWLDRCRWQDVPVKAVVAPNSIVAKRLEIHLDRLFEELGISIVEERAAA